MSVAAGLAGVGLESNGGGLENNACGLKKKACTNSARGPENQACGLKSDACWWGLDSVRLNLDRDSEVDAIPDIKVTL